MIKVGIIGQGFNQSFVDQYHLQIDKLVECTEQGIENHNKKALNDPDVKGLSIEKALSIILQGMSFYSDVEFSLAEIKTSDTTQLMQALVHGLQWMEEEAKPDFVLIGFSDSQGKYQKEQQHWIQKLNDQDCQVICPVGPPPSFPASLLHVNSVADRGFMKAGFEFIKPKTIIEDKFVVLFDRDKWVIQEISNESASALALAKMIEKQVGQPKLLLPNESKPVVLPDLAEIIGNSQKQEEVPKELPQPNLLDKVRSYSKSQLSRLIIPTGRVPGNIKAVRKVSCNGDEETTPCQYRRESRRYKGSHVCGACGCGENRDVFVAGDLPGFEKLDFPYVVCPASMPGFSNYLPSKYESAPDSRKVHIENRFDQAILIEERNMQKELDQKLTSRLGWLDRILGK